ncbi:16S rRNA (cytosine1402-N4)-methyltransferase [Desulfonispora thiosulfatigenes DSM 11270]|uniref:Ribosomal RNA small subunit methyltransferase H n=1 Tax=Desulfonispora thiosulfatigenes DSM 11270 TaxID=656914 RepID=A0A1W1VSU9_DESTI|nr:16S rRNA (cytosine(1402)-N(4))-methyltransferase RsmH [Desulfonispora thiosulfatigenes]SMB96447.1 16S rRNA (cytosine1402-N4)-methyltransferase [Desulfonispora thiosulfatigenes DSM 11270]
MNFEHIPVLLKESINLMDPKPGEKFVDCTLGGGGHSKHFLEKIIPGGHLIALDQDINAINAAKIYLKEYENNVTYVNTNYENVREVINKISPLGVDGIFFDIGVSSHQLDEGERGFSYNIDAPLDMRMDQTNEFTAKELVNTYTEEKLHNIINLYGEERWAKRIAEFIVAERSTSPIETTGQLVDVIKKAIPKKARLNGPHPAKRTFQAIRIEVNRELEVLEKTIEKAVQALNKGGRIGIITFHSLEDRIVKEKFKYLSLDCVCAKELPICMCDKKREIKVLTRKPISASEEEENINHRARSAKLRVAVKL